MEIVDLKHIEDCFDGSYIKELLFSEPITKRFIDLLGKYGKLNYFGSFKRPFFKVIFRDDFYIKGVQGNDTARVLLRNNDDIIFLKGIMKRKGVDMEV